MLVSLENAINDLIKSLDNSVFTGNFKKKFDVNGIDSSRSNYYYIRNNSGIKFIQAVVKGKPNKLEREYKLVISFEKNCTSYTESDVLNWFVLSIIEQGYFIKAIVDDANEIIKEELGTTQKIDIYLLSITFVLNTTYRQLCLPNFCK
jgi:hypothetical protein